MASNFFIEKNSLEKVSIQLEKIPKQIPGATASALNRTLTFTASQTDKEIRNIYSIKSKEVKKTFKKHKASKSNLYAYLESTGRTIALSKFPHKPKNPPKRRRKSGVQVKIKKSGGYKKISVNPSAFVQTIGATNIWKRKDKIRFPVVVLRTLAIPQMIRNNKIKENVQELSAKKLEERVQHEIQWRLNKASKKG